MGSISSSKLIRPTIGVKNKKVLLVTEIQRLLEGALAKLSLRSLELAVQFPTVFEAAGLLKAGSKAGVCHKSQA